MTNEISISGKYDGSQDVLSLFGVELRTKVQRVSEQRSEIEKRWVEDMRQNNGEYPPGTKFPEGGSQAFVNLTRGKTENGEAQLVDLLFQADDKNYGLTNTPDPELAQAINSKEQVVNAEGVPMQFADDKTPFTEGDKAKAVMEQAVEAAEKMEQTIDDQLIECDYSAQARKAIHYAAVIGSGILCGPEVELREQTAWVRDPQTNKYKNVFKQDKRPIVRHVPTWDFFPDMTASRIEECNFIFERSYMSAKILKDMRRIPGINLSNLELLLNETTPKSTQTPSDHVSTLRQMSGIISMEDDQRYEVWRYRGPISCEVLITAGVIKPDAKNKKKNYDGIVIFCGDLVLKAAINPMETEAWPYSVFCWTYDDHCIFGTGIPRKIKQPQSMANTAIRLMFDNTTRSAGPQIVVDDGLEPVDGDYQVTPWKFWKKKDPMMKIEDAFQTFDFKSYQVEIANIFTLAESLIDKESGVPAIQEGQQGQVTPTVGGMSMLINAAGAARRNQVKHWDDYVTVPMIKRFYDWNMQFNEDESIKGDLQVYARGTAALLLKEQQAQALFVFIDKYAAHPVISRFLKTQGYEAMRKALLAIHINPDDVLMTKDEYLAELERMQQQSQEEPPEDPRITAENLRSQNRMREIEAEGEIQDKNNKLQYEIARMRFQGEALKLATHKDLTLAEVQADLQKTGWKLDLDSSMFKTEVMLKQADGIGANIGLGAQQ